MGKKSRANKDKGDILERIVTRLYEDPDVTVQRDVKLPAKGSDRNRERQIDVLISRTVAGFPVRIAIECKNYAKLVDVKAVDAFLSALQDVGIPPQYGIMVSASGFTDGALERAQKEELQLQVLDGLTPDRVASMVAEAVQLLVYVELTVLAIEAEAGRIFHDAEGIFVGMIDDLVWQRWVSGELPVTLGEHEIQVSIPETWVYGQDGVEVRGRTAVAKVLVAGIIVSLPGRAETHVLTTLAARPEHRVRIQTRAYFEEPKGSYPAQIVQTEAELDALMAQPPAVKAETGRFRMPRIRTFVPDPLSPEATTYCYWPPSERVDNIIAERYRVTAAGSTMEPAELTFEYLERTNFQAAFEPISPRYPYPARMPSPGGSHESEGGRP